MPLQANEVTEVLNEQLFKDARDHWSRLNAWGKRRRGGLVKSWMPDGVDNEYRDTMRKARGPWLQFGAEIYAQSINVESGGDLNTWKQGWIAAGMEGRQPALNRDVCENGLSYLLTFPDEHGGVFMRHLKAVKTFHTFEDPWDDAPEYVVTKVREAKPGRDKSRELTRIFDATAMYDVYGDPARPDKIITTEHGLGVNPVALIQSGFTDDDDNPVSPVKIGQEAYVRLVDAGFTLQMVQRYGAFPQKWQTGGVIATDENGNALIRPSVDSMLHNKDYEARFGSFPAADIDKVVTAVDEQFEELTAILQIPPHYMLGKVVNISSDALAASEAGFQRKIDGIRRSMSLGFDHAFKNAAAILGHESDDFAPIGWQDVATRSLGSGADAATKLIAQGADPELAFQLVPTWSRADAHQAAKYRLENLPADEPSAGQEPAVDDPQPVVDDVAGE